VIAEKGDSADVLKELKSMDLKGMQQMWPEMDRDTVKFIFNLFDTDGSGKIDSQEFVMAVALLTSDCKTPAQQLDACFTMFDTERTGYLNRAEFEAMINASVTLSLQTVLQTKEGQAAMTDQLAKEYSEENIEFWKAARSYVEAAAEARAELAKTIADRYIKESGDMQVNIPDGMRVETLKAYDDAVAVGTPDAWKDELFKAAEDEIFTLMDRDTWARLKSDPEMVKSMAANYFEAADKNKDGLVTYHEYRAWALDNPQVLSFFGQLQKAVGTLLMGKEGRASAADVEPVSSSGDDAATGAPAAAPAAS